MKKMRKMGIPTNITAKKKTSSKHIHQMKTINNHFMKKTCKMRRMNLKVFVLVISGRVPPLLWCKIKTIKRWLLRKKVVLQYIKWPPKLTELVILKSKDSLLNLLLSLAKKVKKLRTKYTMTALKTSMNSLRRRRRISKKKVKI